MSPDISLSFFGHIVSLESFIAHLGNHTRGDGFWFVVSALITTAISLNFSPASAPSVRGRVNSSWIIQITLILAFLACFWSIGTVLMIGIGILFGLFTGETIACLLRAKKTPLTTLWPAAVAVLVLSVGYSLPIYEHEISDLFRDSNLSHIKLSLANIELQTDLAPKSNSGSVSAGGGPTGDPGSAVPHPNDPQPGVAALYGEFSESSEYNLLNADYRYIAALYSERDPSRKKADLNRLEIEQAQIKTMIGPVVDLAECLKAHEPEILDSRLLLTYTPDLLNTLFQTHRDILHPDQYKNIPSDILRLGAVVDYVIDRLDTTPVVAPAQGLYQAVYSSTRTHGPCQHRRYIGDNGLLHNTSAGQSTNSAIRADAPESQPYLTLAFADLLLAEGAPDLAADALAAWLSTWNQPGSTDRIQQWYAIRVISKLVTSLEVLAGHSRVYLAVLKDYRKMLSNYVEDSPLRVVLNLDADKCKNLEKNTTDLDIQRRIAFLFIGNEIDVLSAELGFVSEQSTFEKVDELYSRAAKLSVLTPECLPEAVKATALNYSTEEFRTATIAKAKIVAGAMGLAAGEQMKAIAGSAAERNRAQEARNDGEKWVRAGWRDLRPIWNETNPNGNERNGRTWDWHERIFTASPWEQPANLAMRILAQLHKEM